MVKVNSSRYVSLQKLQAALKDIFIDGYNSAKGFKNKAVDEVSEKGVKGVVKEQLGNIDQKIKDYASKSDFNIDTMTASKEPGNIDALIGTDKEIVFSKALNKSLQNDMTNIDKSVVDSSQNILNVFENTFKKNPEIAVKRLKNMTGLDVDIKGDLEDIILKLKKDVYSREKEKILDGILTTHFDELTQPYNVKTINDLVLKKPVKGGSAVRSIDSKIKDVFEEYNKLDLDDKLDLYSRTKSLVASHRKVSYKEHLDKFNMTFYDDAIATIPSKIDKLYVYANKNNMTGTANAIKMFNDFLENSYGFSNGILSLKKDIVNSLKQVEKKGEVHGRALREYGEKAYIDVDSFSKTLDDSNSIEKVYDNMYSKRIRVNKEVAEEIQKKHGVQFTNDDFELSNELTNMFSALRLVEAERSINKFNVTNLPYSRRTMREADWNHDIDPRFFNDNITQGYHGVADNGRSYRPIVITDEYKNHLQSKGDQNIRNYFNEKGKNSAQTYNKLRNIDSGASLHENRKLPSEEVESYLNKYVNNIINSKGQKLITDIKRSYNKSASYMRDFSDAGLDKKRPLNEGVDSMVDSIATHWTNAFQKTQEAKSIVGKAVLGLTDLNTAFALLSPKMLIINDFQPFVTGAPYKGVMNTFYGYRKSLPFFKEMFAGKGIDSAVKSLAKNNLSDLEGAVLNNFFNKYMPDALQSDLWMGGGKLEPLKEVVTNFFKATDIHSRLTTALAAVKMGDDVLNKYGKEFLDGSINSPLSLKKLTKELHLKEFRALEMERLIQALHKGKEEFLTEFAHASVNKEIYNYNLLNRPAFLDAIKKNPYAARAGRFVTWSFYYKEAIDGIFRSYADGDTLPAKRLALLSASWLIGASTVAGADIPFLSNLASYAVGRTPVISPVMNLADMPRRAVGGILVPSISTLLYPITVGLNSITNLAGSNKDSFDYLEKEFKRNSLNQPILNNTWGTYKKTMEELGYR